MFETERESLDLVLRYAVRRVNQRRDLLPITALNCDVMTAPMHDSFLMSRQGQYVADVKEIFWVKVFTDTRILSRNALRRACVKNW